MIIYSKCDGSISEHDAHDAVFGGRRVYFACLGSWIAAFMALLPDIMRVKVTSSGNFVIGCQSPFANRCPISANVPPVLVCQWPIGTISGNAMIDCNVGPDLLDAINKCSMISFYGLILLKMITTRILSRYKHPDKHTNGDNLKSIYKTLILLTGPFIAVLLALIFQDKSRKLRAGISSW